MLDQLASNVALGLATALSTENLLYCVLGVTLGTFVGVLPGIGTLAAMSMLFPLTFYLDPTPALIMLAGIWYGSTFGGSTASILLNLPGTPANAVTCLDGYPMAKQGRAGVALLMTTVASFFGSSVGIVLIMLFSEPLVFVALSFGPAEYFMLMLLGLIAASVVSDGSILKGVTMMFFGAALGLVGTDVFTGLPRFAFGSMQLLDGISLVALAMGLFGIAEVIGGVKTIGTSRLDKRLRWSSMLPSREEVRRSWMPVVRGSCLGSIIGVMPGVGPTIGSFMSYAVEKRVAKDRSRFGNGAIEGIMGPEATNNAADQTSFIPTLSLGVPGSASMALILGVLMIHGLSPGPSLVVESPETFWGLVMSFWIGIVLLLILNIPMIGVWIRIVAIPYRFLFPSIIIFSCIGVYAVDNNVFGIYLMLSFGVLGYLMRACSLPAAPLLLGFVLSPMLEENFRRALFLSHGKFSTFFEGPVNLFLFFVILLMVVFGIFTSFSSSSRSVPR